MLTQGAEDIARQRIQELHVKAAAHRKSSKRARRTDRAARSRTSSPSRKLFGRPAHTA